MLTLSQSPLVRPTGFMRSHLADLIQLFSLIVNEHVSKAGSTDDECRTPQKRPEIRRSGCLSPPPCLFTDIEGIALMSLAYLLI